MNAAHYIDGLGYFAKTHITKTILSEIQFWNLNFAFYYQISYKFCRFQTQKHILEYECSIDTFWLHLYDKLGLLFRLNFNSQINGASLKQSNNLLSCQDLLQKFSLGNLWLASFFLYLLIANVIVYIVFFQSAMLNRMCSYSLTQRLPCI